MTRIHYALCLIVVLAVAIGGCGDGGDGTAGGAYGGKGGSTPADESKNKKAEYSVIGELSVAKVGELGKVLVDRGNHVVYVFHKDEGTTSSCYGPCEVSWPPLLTETDPIAKAGVDADELGTTERKDGTTQVTYYGHPLYTYLEDIRPFEATGNDVTAYGGEWYALRANGEEVGG